MKSTVRWSVNWRSLRDSSMIFLSSATPDATAEIATNREFVRFAPIAARVVFPVPGGPQRIIDGSCPASIALRSTRPFPTRWLWPTNSSRSRGRIRAASGWAWAIVRLSHRDRIAAARLINSRLSYANRATRSRPEPIQPARAAELLPRARRCEPPTHRADPRHRGRATGVRARSPPAHQPAPHVVAPAAAPACGDHPYGTHGSRGPLLR